MNKPLENSGARASSHPFPGLRPYTKNEHDIFFGRGEQIDQMLTSLEDLRFLAVVGSSGCGKSSLVRAGLLPAIEDGFLTAPGEDAGGETPPWRFVRMRPGNAPFTQLAEAIQGAGGLEGDAPGDFETMALTEATLRGGPQGFLNAIADAGVSEEVPVLLLVDQFEEIFRLSDRARRGEAGERSEASVRDETLTFVNLLLRSSTATERPVLVVITMRSDWIGGCDAYPGLPQAVSDGQFLTPRMTRDQLQEAITGPLSAFEATMEPALANRLLNDMGDRLDQLPLMQHALMRTWYAANDRWQRLGDEHVLTVADYEGVGGFSEALSRHLEEAWAELREDEREERIVRHLFLLLTGGEKNGAELTRRMARAQEVAEISETDVAEIGRLADVFRRDNRNFVVASPGGAMGENTILDISHEALLRQWDRLQRWVKLEGESAALFGEILKAARRWETGEAGPWRPPDLEVAIKWRERAKPTEMWARRYGGHCDLVTRFLDWSQDEYEKEQRRERRTRRKLQQLQWGVALLLVLLVAFAVISVLSGRIGILDGRIRILDRRTEILLERSRARELGLTAMNELDQDGERAVLLAMESALAWPEEEELPTEIEMAMRKTVAEAWVGPGFERHRTIRDDQPAKVYSIGLDPEGGRAVTGSQWTEGIARVWEVESGKELAVLDHSLTVGGRRTSGATISNAKFSPDGQRILTTTWRKSGYAYIWDANFTDQRPALPPPFRGHSDWVAVGAFHPVERWVATGSMCRENNGERIAEKEGQEILIWDYDTRELVEDAAGRQLLDVRRYGVRPGDKISSLTFRPNDGRRLLSTCFDGSVFIWNLEPKDREPEGELPAEADAAGSAAGAEQPDPPAEDEAWPKEEISEGVYRYADGTIEIQEAHWNDRGEPERVWDGDFSPDGKLIATVGNDRFLRIWEAETGKLLSKQVHNDSILQVAFADDEHVVTACNDLVIHFWKLEWIPFQPSRDGSKGPGPGGVALALRKSGELTGHRGWIRGLAVRDEGRLVASASEDGSARIWTPPPKAEVAWIESPDADYWCAAIHVYPPEGSADKGPVRVYCGTNEGELHVYDGRTGQQLEHPVFRPESALHEKRLRFVAVSPDGSRLLTASNDGTAILWDAPSGRKICVIDAHSGIVAGLEAAPVYKARFSGDGRRVVTAGGDGVARVWTLSDLESGRAGPESSVLLELPGENESGERIGRVVFDARFSPDGKQVVTADFTGDTVSIWDAASGERQRVLKPGWHAIMSACFSPDGQHVAAASMSGSCYLWQVDALDEEPLLLEQRGGVRSVDFRLRGKELVLLTGGSDGSARFWEDPWNRAHSHLRDYLQVITDASFSNDGKFVVTTGAGGPVRVSFSDPWSVYWLAAQRVTRKLTPREREAYGVTRKLTEEEKRYYEQLARDEE